MSIAIYSSVSNHEEFISNLAKHLSHDRETVTIYSSTPERFAERKTKKLHSREDHEENIKTILRDKKNKVLIIDELYGRISPRIPHLLKNIRYITVIHNGRKSHYLNPYLLKLQSSLSWLKIVRNSKKLICISPVVLRYLRTSSKKEILFFPFKETLKSFEKSTNADKIILAGSVNSKKNQKLYRSFIRKIKRCNLEDRLVLLGNVGKNQKLLKELVQSKIKFYDSRIPEKEYMETIRKGKVLINLSKQYNFKGFIGEKYGISKDSGIFFDGIKYQLPVITNIQNIDKYYKTFSFLASTPEEIISRIDSIDSCEISFTDFLNFRQESILNFRDIIE